MADAGARKIKSLLDTPSRTLGDNMKALRTGLRSATDEDPAPSSISDSIDVLQSYFSRLESQIEAIKTTSTVKLNVLSALSLLDGALTAMAAGVSAGAEGDWDFQLEKARRQAARAASDLARASKRLA